MATVVIDLPEAMKRRAEDEAASAGYGTAGELMLDLLRRELERREKIANMQRLIDEAIESGVSERSMEEILADARREAGLAPEPDGVQA